MKLLKVKCEKCQKEQKISPSEMFCQFCGNPLRDINDENIFLMREYYKNEEEIKYIKSGRWEVLDFIGDWLKVCGTVFLWGILSGVLGIFLGQWTMYVWFVAMALTILSGPCALIGVLWSSAQKIKKVKKRNEKIFKQIYR